MGFENRPQDVKNWYLAQLKPNAVQIAERNLARQCFVTFNPTHRATLRRGGRFIERQAPLFPGYLFVALDPRGSAWRSVNGTHGVARLVSFGSRPAMVPTSLVTALRARCDQGNHLASEPAFAPGDQVRVRSGPLAEFASTVERIDADQRIWLLLDIMGRDTRVSVAPDDLFRA